MSAKTPYIGSKISLISKAEIRYEGVLYAVDTKEATVTLAKVRSFGTEDRQVPKPIPPRAETYEFIIFRGSDIKDLHVSEIPAKTEEAPQDPAIVSATSQAPPTTAPATSDPAPPPSSSHPLLPPSQPPTYSPFPPAPGGFSPFGVPYFKPQVMMGGGAPPTIQRPPHIPPPPPTAPHTMHPMPPSSHPPFPPFIPGQLPIPLSQKSPFAVPNPPSLTAPIVSTIMKPSPGTVAEGKTQSPVASSTPQTASGIATKPQTSDGNVTPAQTTPQAASESESPLARMNPVPPPSQVTQAPPPSLLSHVTAPQDPTPVPDPSISQATEAQPISSTTMQITTEGLSDTQKPASHGKTPLISDPPPNAQPMTSDKRIGSSVSGARPERGQERGRARGGRKNLKAGPRGGSRGGGSLNQQEPAYRYENDFDFESANAQFNKEMLEEEFKKKLRVSKGKDGSGWEESHEIEEEENEEEDGELVEETEPGEFYDKSKSFFDSISCENPAGSGNRRTNWNEERELNTETFGVSSVNRFRQGRGRGRWRGRGRGRGGYGRRGSYGRGGYRGGRGGQRDGGRGEPRDDRPPRGRRGDYNGPSSGYHRGSGGYRGQGRRGRGGERSKSGSTAEHSQREATEQQ